MATNSIIDSSTPSLSSTTTVTAVAGDFTIPSGKLVLTAATSSTVGQVLLGGSTPGTNNALQMTGGSLFVGPNAGTLTTAQSKSYAMGSGAGSALSTGATGGTVGIGYQAFHGFTSGTFSVAVGYQAGLSATGSDVVTIGASTYNHSGTTGSRNSLWGYLAGQNYTGGEHDNICWHHAGVVSENNACHVGTSGTGNGQVSTCYIAGINGVTVTGTALLCTTGDKLGNISSSKRFKENIIDMGESSKNILDLRPVTFTYKIDNDHNQQVGLIAEEVIKIMPNLVVLDEEDLPFSVEYHELCTFLINEFKKLSVTLHHLEEVYHGNE